MAIQAQVPAEVGQDFGHPVVMDARTNHARAVPIRRVPAIPPTDIRPPQRYDFSYADAVYVVGELEELLVLLLILCAEREVEVHIDKQLVDGKRQLFDSFGSS